MITKNKLFIIIDAYGGSRNFRRNLMQSGYLCAHLLGTTEALPRLTLLDLDLYNSTLVHRGNLDETIGNIEKLAYQFNAELCEILPGAEPGVLLADQLSQHFNLHSNGTKKSLARRNKFAMAQELDAAGIAIPDYCCAHNLKDALVFARKKQWPIVLKPLDSAGTDGVYFCQSENNLSDSFYSMIGKKNNMGIDNHSAFLQTFLYGKEYMVNTVSHSGYHYISDIWLAEKIILPGQANIYDKSLLVDSKNPEFSILQSYVFSVLNALDIKFGPAHAEVIMTPKGPMLVEIGARVSGGVDPEFHHTCLEQDQISITLESYLRPKEFLKKIGNRYRIKKAAMRIHLSSQKSGKIISFDFPRYLERIPSLVNYHLKISLGDILTRTFDLSSSPGVIHIAGENEDALHVDYAHIQQLFEEHVQVLQTHG